MNDVETSEIREADGQDLPEDDDPVTQTFDWEVWKDGRIALSEPPGFVSDRALMFRGLIEHHSAYSILNYDYQDKMLGRIAHIGGGEGNYVLIHDGRVQRVSIVAETVYRLATDDS